MSLALPKPMSDRACLLSAFDTLREPTSSTSSKLLADKLFVVMDLLETCTSLFAVSPLSLLLHAPNMRLDDRITAARWLRILDMVNFLGKLTGREQTNSPAAALKDKVTFRDSDDPRILYRLSDRARKITIRVNNSEREVVVTVPGKRSINKAQNFVKEQKDWIEVQLETLPPPQPFEPGAEILLKGERYKLFHVEGRGHPKIDDYLKEVIVPAPEDAFAGRVRRLLIREAREALEQSTYYYAGQLGKEVAKVSVRDTSSRWGSCITRKGKGHISYSWRLISAPHFVLDYVAAHELSLIHI